METIFSTKYINTNWRIKVFGYDAESNKINTLVGVSGLINLIGLKLANKFLERANNCMEDVCICRLRRGLKISFYCK